MALDGEKMEDGGYQNFMSYSSSIGCPFVNAMQGAWEIFDWNVYLGSKDSVVKILTRGEGVKNPENLADVICEWPLTGQY